MTPSEQEIPTPRVDAVAFSALGVDRAHLQQVVQIDFARTLERELSRLRSELADERARAERAEQSLLELERQRDNLAMFAKMLVLKVRKHEPDATIAKGALAYLCSKGLQGSPLREDALDAARPATAAPEEGGKDA